jgi:hemoglobin
MQPIAPGRQLVPSMDERTLYDELGGREGVATLVDRFYTIMDTDAFAAPIRAMHPADLAGSREKLTWFLTGWLGGPQDYVEQRGHPRLRARHLPFAINESARDQWMHCMIAALSETTAAGPVRHHLTGSLARLADHMRNQEG